MYYIESDKSVACLLEPSTALHNPRLAHGSDLYTSKGCTRILLTNLTHLARDSGSSESALC